MASARDSVVVWLSNNLSNGSGLGVGSAWGSHMQEERERDDLSSKRSKLFLINDITHAGVTYHI
jgi:hypothetical protein